MGLDMAGTTALVRALAPRKTSGPIVVRVPSPRSPAKSKGKGKAKHHRQPNLQARMLAHAVGGAILGFIDKSFPNLPTVPLLGRAGSIAALAYFFGAKHKIAQDVALAGSSVAGYELGKEGKISGVVGGHRTVGEQLSTV